MRIEAALVSLLPPPFFFLLRPKSRPKADLKVDFFRCTGSLLWAVCPVGVSLTVE
jgi:hypothetical protein